MGEEAAYDLFVSYAAEDAAWVEGALLDALAAAGVRVHSEAAFALGAPRLREFERAVIRSRRVLLVLSPAYLADDTAAFVDLLAQTYGLESATWPVIPLLLHPVALPPRLAMLHPLDATDPARREEAIARLCAEAGKPAPPPVPRPPCPYPGMRPFTEGEARLFHGREAEAEELVQRLRAHPFLAAIGPSGSGKSSVVFAGMVPRLRASGLFGPGPWRVLSVRPGAKPLTADTSVVGGDQPAAGPTFADLIGAPAGERLLLIVDQFEEAFTLAAPEEAVRFQEAIAHLAEQPNCYVVLTCRADFYPELMASPLYPEIQAHRTEVLPLGGAGLRRAIVQPAEATGVYVEAALVERLVSDAAGEPGVLPLVQETLVLLWERLERRFLSLRAYEALVLPRSAYGAADGEAPNGLQVAVARHADATLAALSPDKQTIARRIFLRLVQFSEGRADTRRQQPVAALRTAGDDPALFAATLGHLAANRLVTLGGHAGETARTADLAHEALIGGWPHLRQWLAERRAAEQTRRRLEAKADEWVRLGEGHGGLLDETELPEAEGWLAGADAVDLGHGAALPALVEASRAALAEEAAEREAIRQRELAQAQALAAEQQQRLTEQAAAAHRLRRRFALAAGFATLALAAALIALYFFDRAGQDRDRARAEANARSTAQVQALSAAGIAETEAAAAATAQVLAQDNADLAAARASEAEAERNRAVAQEATAQAERGRAEEQTRLATSRQLAAQSLTQMKDRPDLSLLLALHAYRTADSYEARDSLLTALGADQRLTTYLRGHTGGVNAVVFSPDGSILASSGCGKMEETTFVCTEGQIFLWDVATSKPLGAPMVTEVNGGLWPRLAFSPDGTLLASSGCHEQGADGFCTRGQIRLWDVATRQAKSEPLIGHGREVTSLAFSPDGTMLASGASDLVDGEGFGTIILWDLATGRPSGSPLTGHLNGVVSLAFSPDGDILASGGGELSPQWGDFQDLGGGGDGIFLWDVSTKHLLREPLAHKYQVLALDFSPDGALLASGSGDGIRFWDMGTGELLAGPLPAHPRAQSVAFGADGKTLVSGGYEGQVIVWDVTTQAPIGSPLIGHTDVVYGVGIAPDGRTVASGSGDSAVMLWDIAADHRLSASVGGPLDWGTGYLAFGPDGDTFVSMADPGLVLLWDLSTGQPVVSAFEDARGDFTAPTFSPDGTILAGAGCGRTAESGGCVGRVVRLWDVATRSVIADLPTGQVWVENLAFSPDGMTITAASGDLDPDEGSILRWDVRSRRPVGDRLSSGMYGVSDLTYSPDGSILAWSGCAESGNHGGCAKGQIRLWDVVENRALGDPLDGQTEEVTSIDFAPDGKTLASSGAANAMGNTARVQARNNVLLWDVGSRRQLTTLLSGHPTGIWHAAFTQGGDVLVTRSDDGIVLWDLDARRPLGESMWGDAAWNLRGLVVGPDGRWAISLGCRKSDESGYCDPDSDGRLVMWDIDIQSWVARACWVANRDLTDDERKEFLDGAADARSVCGSRQAGDGLVEAAASPPAEQATGTPAATPLPDGTSRASAHSFTSTTYGYSLAWDDTWTAAKRSAEENGERLVLTSTGDDGATVVFQGHTAFEGDSEACVAAGLERLAADASVSEAVPVLDDRGEPIGNSRDGRNSAVVAFTTVAADGTPVAMVQHMECRPVLPDKAVLSIDFLVPAEAYAAQAPRLQALTASLIQPHEAARPTATPIATETP